MIKDLRVNADRMLASFNQLALIGATADGGVHRPALSGAHLAARKWFREEVERSGLEFCTDGAGNHSAVLPVTPALAPGASVASQLRRSNPQCCDGDCFVVASLLLAMTNSLFL